METRAQIRSFIVETFFAEEFADDESFQQSGLIDSMGMLQLVSFLEERFGISLGDEEMIPENLDTLARVAAFVDRKCERILA